MLKLPVTVLAVVLAGTASAAGWRDLRVDGSSEQAFSQSMTEFKDALSAKREYVLGEALKDIWTRGEQAAAAEQREYTAGEYYKLLDGLRYDDVVTFTDPTGDTAKRRYRATPGSSYASKKPTPGSLWIGFRDTSAEHWALFPDTPRGGAQW